MTDGADRLHALDLVWLEMQGDGPPIAIGTVAVAVGPAPPDDELLAMVAQRLALGRSSRGSLSRMDMSVS